MWPERFQLWLFPDALPATLAGENGEGAVLRISDRYGWSRSRSTPAHGSTYNLLYDPEKDQFRGVYYHAGLQQIFDVVFVRSAASP